MPDPKNDSHFTEASLIFSYSRQQAIEDGVLIDLTEWAKEAGFTIPAACTAAVWRQYVVPPESARGLGQSERGRAHDLLWMLYLAIRNHRGSATSQLQFNVLFQQSTTIRKTVRFKSICGPGDPPDLVPVITILLPHED